MWKEHEETNVCKIQHSHLLQIRIKAHVLRGHLRNMVLIATPHHSPGFHPSIFRSHRYRDGKSPMESLTLRLRQRVVSELAWETPVSKSTVKQGQLIPTSYAQNWNRKEPDSHYKMTPHILWDCLLWMRVQCEDDVSSIKASAQYGKRGIKNLESIRRSFVPSKYL